jgi:hypothetical protein
VAVRVEGQREFREVARSMLTAEEKVLKEVGKGFRAVSKPVVSAIRDEVRSSKGSSPGRRPSASSVDRQLHALARSGKGTLKPLSERQVRSVQKRLGRLAHLRENIAAAAGAAVSAGPKSVALAFKVRAGSLPPSQRKLPRRWDSPSGWKHPVYGNRKVWVSQKGNPYFSLTIYTRRPDIDAGVEGAFERAGDLIVHPEETT